jgi:multiple sugar transport system substrate-binding protein
MEGNMMKSTRLILAFALVLLLVTSNVFAWSYKEAAEPYRGQTVRLIGDSYAPWFAYKELKAEFEEMTGIKVVMEDTDFVTQIEKFTSDMVARTKVYDGTFMAHFRLGEYAERDWLVEVEELLAMPGVQDPTFHVAKDIPPAILNNACSYQGKIYGPPYAFVPPFYCYREDLAGHPDEQKAFKAKYGYDMPVPPETYLEFYELVEFFTRKKGEKLAGKTLDHDFYGTVLALKRHMATWRDYQALLNGMGGAMLTPEGRLSTDFQLNIKALEFMISLIPFSPPGCLEYNWDEQYADMAQGLVFSYRSWIDTFPYLEDPKESKVAGKLGYFLPPDTHRLTTEAHPWVIPRTSKRKEAAWLLMQWFSGFDVQKRYALMGGNTARADVMNDPEIQKLPYMPYALESINYLVEAPRIPGTYELWDTTVQAITKAATGEATPTEALRWAAKKHRDIVQE